MPLDASLAATGCGHDDISYRIIFVWFCALQVALALPADDGLNLPSWPANDTDRGLVCSPFGVCEPCPAEALQEPFCKPFGNRRLLHCANATAHLPLSHEHEPPSTTPSSHPPVPNRESAQHPEGEIPAWESCGRIIHQERADFYEFVACNILFAVVALFVLFARSKRLNALQARQLAARIGIIRNNTGGSGRLV